MILRGLFTSESVSDGHPDKLADQISDAIVDAFLGEDPLARVACETFVTDGFVVVAGEFRTRSADTFASVRSRAADVARGVLRDAGYADAVHGIDPDGCEVIVRFSHQSADISQGVDRSDGPQGAGDQGMMFGYASDETEVLMPLPILLAHRLMGRHRELRQGGELAWLRPDGKSQVSVRYRDGSPVAVETVVLSTQHAEGTPAEVIRRAVEEAVVEHVIPPALRGPAFRVLVNPTGAFVVGGPKADTGLTGRKNVVDTYGGACAHGGEALSGKDPSKVDRSGAYAARHVAKNVVAAGLARRCTVQVAYAIGVADPVSLLLDTHGTGCAPDEVLEGIVARSFDLTPGGIIRDLDLNRPIYRKTAAFGHFGLEDPDFSWERTDRVALLRGAAGLPGPERRRSTSPG
jgi:S-adenosylmethionine synthetase